MNHFRFDVIQFSERYLKALIASGFSVKQFLSSRTWLPPGNDRGQNKRSRDGYAGRSIDVQSIVSRVFSKRSLYSSSPAIVLCC